MRPPLLSSVFLTVLFIPTLGYAWTCGDALVDERDAQSYGTVLIGDQCWMAENLNVGTMITSCSEGYVGRCSLNGETPQDLGTSCNAIQKHCFNDNESNCDIYGGMYNWPQAMCGLTAPGAQGICPIGWHIPTHNEFTTLERSVCTSDTCETDFPYDLITTGTRGTNEGTILRAGSFAGLLAGYRNTDGAFKNLGTTGSFWSSVESDASAWRRFLSGTKVTRNPGGKLYGDAVRCLRNPFSTTLLAISPTPSVAGGSITLTATVWPSSAEGTVTLYQGTDTLGTVTLGHGSGSLTIDTLGLGVHSFTVTYSGDDYFPGSTSDVILHTVNPPPPPPGGGRGSRSPGRGGDAPQIDIRTRRILSDQPDSVSPLYDSPETSLPSTPVSVTSPMRDRLAARIEKRIAQFPRLRTLLLKVLERVDRRLLNRIGN